MNISSILSGALIALVLTLILRESIHGEVKVLEDGTRQISVHKGLYIFALFILFSGIFFAVVFGVYSKNNEWFVLSLPALAISSSLAGYLLAFSKRHKAFFSDEEIEHFNFRGEATKFSWSEIKSITYSKFKGAHIIEVKGKKLKFSDFLVGGKEFITFAKSKLESQH